MPLPSPLPSGPSADTETCARVASLLVDRFGD
jgi:hypothetical protein